MKSKSNKKILFAISLIAILLLLSPNKTGAQFTVNVNSITDPGTVSFYTTAGTALGTIAAAKTKELSVPSVWEIARKEGIEPALAAAAKDVARGLIDSIFSSTVDWINNGFEGPNGESGPAFIADPGKFLQQTADQVVGEMIFNDPDLNFLCSPFQLQVKLALGLNYNQSFAKRINCTLTDVKRNIQNAPVSADVYTNFSGWNNWLQITTQPQNNAVGAYLIAQSELDSRVAARQSSVSAELSYGQGALTYMKCDEVTYNKSGNVVSRKTFTGSPSYAQTKTKTSSDGSYTKFENCAVKTPGIVITEMLGFKSTSDQRMNELQAALGNGIDNVLGALANQLLKVAAEQLQEGVLGEGAAAQEYRSTLGDLSGQIQANYNTTLQNLSNSQQNGTIYMGSQFQSFNTNFGEDYSEGFNQYTPPAGYEGNLNDPLAVPRGNAISRIVSLGEMEMAYQDSYMTTANMLLEAKDAFIISRNCNASYGNPTTVLRARLINANVITNIDGTQDYSREVANIPWNIIAINNLLDISNEHIDILNTAGGIITSATNTTAINDAMIPVNSTSFNIDPHTEVYDNAAQWLRGMRDIYSTSLCPIDLTEAFSTSTQATSTEQ